MGSGMEWVGEVCNLLLLSTVSIIQLSIVCNSYNMLARVLAHLLREGAKRLRAINELSVQGAMLWLVAKTNVAPPSPLPVQSIY